MKRRFVLVTSALLAAALGAGLASSGSAQQTGPPTLAFTEHAVSEFDSNVGSKRFGPGDGFGLTARLRTGGETVGREQVACTAVARTAAECQGTLHLEDGKIFASGGLAFSNKFSLAVVGGTGAYTGARGTLTVTERNRRDKLEVTLLP